MKPLLLLSLLLCCQSIFAQTPGCGFDELRKNRTSIRHSEAASNAQLYAKAIQQGAQGRQPQTTISIPVVVHAIHQNGPENLPDTQVTRVINELNLRFQNAAPFYDATGADMGIQFCLASVDPFGNPANGITHDTSIYTDVSYPDQVSDVNMKNVSRWEPKLYLNVWIARTIVNQYSVVGYASLPAWAATNWDGVVIQYNFFNSSILAHEVGHYLGLYHTFNYDCNNSNCLLDGDQVCDTPPDITSNNTCGGNSCNTDTQDTTGFSPFVSDVDELPNYMDYTSCRRSFTAGQGSRMVNATNLFRSELLSSNGCGQHPGGGIPTASFIYRENCQRGFDFINTSQNSLGVQWDFDGDGRIDNYGDSVNFSFTTTGLYRAKIYAAGYGGTDTFSQLIFIKARPYAGYPLKRKTGYNVSPLSNKPVFCKGAVVELFGEPGMASYQWSTGDTTQNIRFIPDSAFAITLTTVDANGLTWTTCSPAAAEPIAPAVLPSLSTIGPDTTFCAGDTLNILVDLAPNTQSAFLYTTRLFYILYRDTVFHEVFLQNNSLYSVSQVDSNFCINSDTLFLPGGSTPQRGTISRTDSVLTYYYGNHQQWYFNGNLIPNSDSPYLIARQPGCYNAYAWYTNPACGSFALDTICYNYNPLPLQSMLASGYMHEGKALISWTTKGEMNCRWMHVQQSNDGQAFETVQTHAASGSGDHRYKTVVPLASSHQQPLYFRIQSEDKDGMKSHSNTVAIRTKNDADQLSLSPNPAKDLLQVNMVSSKSGQVALFIVDAKGQRMQWRKLQLQNGLNTYRLDISTLPKGVYFLMMNGEAALGQKFVKE